MGNKGTGTTGFGLEGSPTGNSSEGKSSGVGGYGTFDLNGRSLGSGGLPMPVYNVQDEGRVVVTITVNPAGQVISTSINKRTNTVNASLRKAAEEAAMAIAGAPVAEVKVPKPRYWTNSLLTKIDFGQTNLTNWAAGGYNSVTLKSFIDANANYKKDELFFNNRLQLDYGFLYSEDKPFIQKSDDRMYYEGKFGYKAARTLNYSAQFNFKSQFSNSYNYPIPSKPDTAPDDWEPGKSDWKAHRKVKSGFISPAYTNIAIGIDWVPTKWLTVNIAPLTGGFVVVTDETLRKSYGMEFKKKYDKFDGMSAADIAALAGKDKDEYDAFVAGKSSGDAYRTARFELGAQIKIDGKLQINDNFKYTSQLVLFSDYLDNPQNIRVNWDNRFDWKIAKYFSLTVTTNLIYDDKVMVKTDKTLKKYPDGRKAVQFKESLAFGFSYTIASRKR